MIYLDLKSEISSSILNVYLDTWIVRLRGPIPGLFNVRMDTNLLKKKCFSQILIFKSLHLQPIVVYLWYLWISLKYQTLSGNNDFGIGKFEFVAKTQFLYKKCNFLTHCTVIIRVRLKLDLIPSALSSPTKCLFRRYKKKGN